MVAPGRNLIGRAGPGLYASAHHGETWRVGAQVIPLEAVPQYICAMPSIGPLELGIVLLIVLIVFGPKRLPGLGRQLGSGMREFKDSITGKDKDTAEGRGAFGADGQPPARAELAPPAAEPEGATGEPRREDQPASRADS